MAEEKSYPKGKRGFASMNPYKQREIASRGGRKAHANGTAHQWTPEEARAAGHKGGTSVSRNSQHMADIGTIGGKAAQEKRKTNYSVVKDQPEASDV